ncbi:hypothetical protein H0H87_012286 [Tephrocybe sp. NHM501043]|nr:hypothetical protein H0H87_012286 [Tephrocybe sp. NHM501043]
MSQYLLAHIPDAPVELIMVDETIPETRSDIAPAPSLRWDPSTPELRSKPIHNATSVALALQEMGYEGKFYQPYEARHLAANNNPLDSDQKPTSDWPDYQYAEPNSDEYPYVAQLLVHSKKGIPFTSPITLTLPSPYVLPRFALLNRIFKSDRAKDLLFTAWGWTRSLGLTQFNPTALAIMTGECLQKEHPLASPKHLWERFLRPVLQNLLHVNKFTTQMVTIHDLESPPSSSVLRSWIDGGAVDSCVLPSGTSPEPECWADQPLIVRDPYALTQNHAEGVSMAVLARFATYSCQSLAKYNNKIHEEIWQSNIRHKAIPAISRRKISIPPASQAQSSLPTAPESSPLHTLAMLEVCNHTSHSPTPQDGSLVNMIPESTSQSVAPKSEPTVLPSLQDQAAICEGEEAVPTDQAILVSSSLNPHSPATSDIPRVNNLHEEDAAFLNMVR